MDPYDRKDITVDKEKEMRTKEIAQMISEGGLGADQYYNIQKKYMSREKEEESREH